MGASASADVPIGGTPKCVTHAAIDGT
jgi:hypothetical protein